MDIEDYEYVDRLGREGRFVELERYLVEIVKSGDRPLIAHVVRQIGHLGDPSSIQGLQEVLREDDFAVRCEAATALSSFPRQLVRCGLRSALSDPCESVRICAIDSAGRLQDGAYVPDLRAALLFGSRVERAHAAFALGEIATDDSVRVLTMALKERRRDGIGAIVLALAETDMARSTNTLSDVVVEVRNPVVRRIALLAMRRRKRRQARMLD